MLFTLIHDFFHPKRKPAGAYPLVTTLILVLAGLVAGFVLGYQTGKHNRWAKYKTNIPVPTQRATVPFRAAVIATRASVVLASYPDVGSQDGLGECAAFATAQDLTYLWRIAHPGSWLNFSARQMYDHYSDTYSGGQDAGSWPDQDAEISASTGLLQRKALPQPPYVIDNPIPQYDAWGHLTAVDAAKHRFATTFTALSGYTQGGGAGLVQGMKQAIDSGKPVLIAFPVYPEYDSANASNPNIYPPSADESERGGHENVALAFDDFRPMPDGSRGAFLVQNQWTKAWGLNGRAWMSYTFVAQYVFGAETASIGPAARVSVPPVFYPNHNPGHPAPHRTSSVPHAGVWYVRHVVTHDTGVDVSALMNTWGDYYHIPPVGLAATAGIESGVNQYADRCCIPGDTSYGMMQETTGTTCSYTGGQVCSIDAVRAYLDNPSNAIRIAAHYYQDAEAYHGGRIPFPNAYIMYNAGPGYGDSFYFNPSGIAADHFYNGFLPWWNIATSQYAGPPPRPKAFPAKKWGWYAWKHRRPHITYKDGKRIAHGAALWLSYGPNRAGSVVSREQYAHGVMTQRFQDRRLYWRPRTRGATWIRVHHIQ